eukprot:7783744-Pyramimonas_sp.AAC.1
MGSSRPDRVLVSNKRMTRGSPKLSVEPVACQPSNCTCPAPERLIEKVYEPCVRPSDASREQIVTPVVVDKGTGTVSYPNLALQNKHVFEPGSLKQPRAEVRASRVSLWQVTRCCVIGR